MSRLSATRLFYLLSGTALTALGAANPAWAQPAPASVSGQSNVDQSATSPTLGTTAAVGDDVVADIVVTAQKRAQSVQDVPISITVATGKFLKDQNIVNLADFSKTVANLNIGRAVGSSQLRIRGVGSGYNAGFDQAVGVFVDNAYRGRSKAIQAALFDVERVEVLKGPQSIFFGNSASAGAINIITRKPGEDFGVNGRLLYGRFNTYAAELGLDAPLTDALSLRVAGQATGTDGYVRNVRLNNNGPHLQDQVGRVSVLWKPTTDVRVDVRVDGGHQRDYGTLDGGFYDCPPRAGFTFNPSPFDVCGAYLRTYPQLGQRTDFDYISVASPSHLFYRYIEPEVTTSVSLGGYTLTSTSAYFHHNINETLDIPPGTRSIQGTEYNLGLSSLERYSQVSQEVRLISPVGKPLEYLIGLYYQHSILNADNNTGFYVIPAAAIVGFPGYDPVASLVHVRQTERILSAFGAATLHITDALRLNVGLRYSDVDKRGNRNVIIGRNAAALNPGFDGEIPTLQNVVPAPLDAQAAVGRFLNAPLGNFTNPKSSTNRLLPSAGLQYDLARGVMTYVSFSEGFKAGGFAIGSRDQFQAERVSAYEAGIKTTLFDRKLTANLSVFRSDFSNLQTATIQQSAAGIPSSVIGNVGSSRTQGIEADIRATPVSGLSLGASFAYLHARFRRYPNAPCTAAQTAALPNGAPCTQNLAGGVQPFSPKFSGSITTDYRAPVTDSLDLKLGSSLNFTSKYFLFDTLDPLLVQRAYAKLDLRAGVGTANGKWELSVIARNVTDKVTATTLQNTIPTTVGSRGGLSDEPRTVAVQLIFNLGH